MHRFALAARACRGWLALLVFGGVLTACADATTASSDAKNGETLTTAAAAAAANKNNNTVNVNISGLPAGVAASVTVTGPSSFSRTLTATTSMTALANGTFTVVGSPVVANGTTYTAAPVTQSVSVNKGSTATASVVYAAQVAATGRLTVDITMPDATLASVTVTGPGGYVQALSTSTTLSSLVAGSYTVAAASVVNGGKTYNPTPVSQTITVTAGATSFAAISYAIAVTDPGATLNVNISGLPAGAAASVNVTGPSSFSRALTATTSITGLVDGTYTVTGAAVVVSGTTYTAAPATQTVSVNKTSAASASVVYSAQVVANGRLTVDISMPAPTAASVTVTGPGGYSQTVSASTTLSALVPGSYTVAAASVSTGGTTYNPSPTSQVVSVASGATGYAPVTYTAVVTDPGATLNVTISGLPAGAAASVNVTGPSSFSRALTSTTSITGLVDGTYTVTGATVVVSGTTYTAAPATQSVSVNKTSAANATVVYSAQVVANGRLTVDIAMPAPTAASVTVTGPGGYSQSLSASTTLSALAPGSYTVAAASVSTGGTTYNPSPTSQVVSVASGATGYAAVTYTAVITDPGTTLNLRIAGMYLTQSVQTMSGAVPMVAGRAGVLRVFAIANGINVALPVVRARVYRNGALVTTLTSGAPELSVPTAINEGSATASWNFALAGSLIQGGMSILVDVDPNNLIPEAIESDNQFPTNGTPKTFDVRAVPNFDVRFVPVKQSGTGQTGDVSAANADPFLQRTRDMHPINTVSWSVRTPYTTSYTLASDGTNWNSVLSELYSLRAADGSTANYYGVAKVGYSSGVAGMGYIGAAAALGWDYMPSGSEIMAHELGHNWGRQHAPCGGVSGADGAFPYAGGAIGVYGFNVRLGQLLSPSTSDLMGYCSPTWISDYTYNAVLAYRGSSAASTTTSANVQPGLLVWGRVNPDGSIVLEPAMRMTGRSVLPTRRGQYTVDATDESGKSVFSLSFDPVEVAAETGAGGRHFAFVVPMADATQATLSSLTVRGKGRAAGRTSSQSMETLELAASQASLVADGPRHARVAWNSSAEPMVMVRDAITGEVLSFARGGNAGFSAQNPEIELVVSDGVRSVVKKSRVRGR